MKNNKIFRNRLTPLYDPKEEGLGSYDIHYINAYKKKKELSIDKKVKINERYAA